MEGLIALGVLFDSLGLDRRITKALKKQGFEHPTLVQEKAIPLALQGKDILARAKTGSGKTIAYAVPVIQKILLSKEAHGAKKGVRCAVLLPTRELCAQVTEVFNNMLACCKGLVTIADLGIETEDSTQSTMLREKPDIVITTPSRLLAFLKGKLIDLKICFESIVVDEADLTLSLGYEADVQGIAPYLPKVYQGYLMSATLDERTQAVRDLLLHNPATLHLKDAPDSAAASLLTEAVVRCSKHDKFLVTFSLLRLGLVPAKIIIFVHTVKKAMQLKLFLDRFTIQNAILNAKLPRESRLSIIKQFNSNAFRCLIATDELMEDLGVEEEEEEIKPENGNKTASVDVVDVDTKPTKKRKIEPKDEASNSADDDEESSDSENSDMKDLDTSIVKEEADDDDDDIQVSSVTKSNAINIKDEDDGEDTIKNEDASDENEVDESDDKENKGKKSKKIKNESLKTEFSVARGVDFKQVQTVINFDFPNSTKAYVHRIGRTARGGAKGLAISLISGADEEALANITKKRNKNIPDFGLQLQSIESFRYRCEDVLANITENKIKLATAEIQRKELLNSKKLRAHFEANPQEKALLEHAHKVAVIPLAAAKRQNLRSIPNYLVPNALAAYVNQNTTDDLSEKRKNGFKGKYRKRKDPILKKRRK